MKNYKTFIAAISLATLTCQQANACWGGDDFPSSYNLFTCVEPLPDIKAQRIDDSAQFWASYTGEQLTDAFRYSVDYIRLYHFDEDSSHELVCALRNKGLTEGLEYLKLNTELYELSTAGSSWDYRVVTAKDYAQLLDRIEAYKPTNKDLVRRKTFLKMRCLFALKDYTTCLRLWDSFASKWEPSSLRSRMEGYVAGIYYRNGEYDKAIPMFFELGDDESIQLCVNRMLGSTSIEREYEKDPNSKLLGYILEDYANYYYHSCQDEGWTPNDNDPIWTAVRTNAEQVIALSERVIKEGKANDLQMWQAFVGFLQLSDHQDAKAYESFVKAEKLRGNGLVRPLIRHYKLAASLAMEQKGADYDQYLVKELEYWHGNNAAEGAEFEVLNQLYGAEMPRRINDYIESKGDTLLTFMINSVLDPIPTAYSMDRDVSMTVLGRLRDALNDKPLPDTPLNKFVMDHNPICLDQVNEILGTRMMRQDNYEGAVSYLQQVSETYLQTMAITPYLLNREMPEMPFSRKNYNEEYETDQHIRNVKLDFCHDVLKLKLQIEESKGEAKAQAALELAEMLYQGSLAGDLWAISEYGWSSYGTHYNELNDQAISAIRTALSCTKDYNTLVLCHFGLAASCPDENTLEVGDNNNWVVSAGNELSEEGYNWLARQKDKSHPIYTTCDWLDYYTVD